MVGPGLSRDEPEPRDSEGLFATLHTPLDDVVALDATLDDIRRTTALGDDGVLRPSALGVEHEREDDRQRTGHHADDADRVARAAAQAEDAGVDVRELEDRADDEQEDPESDTHALSLAGVRPECAPLPPHTRPPPNAHARPAGIPGRPGSSAGAPPPDGERDCGDEEHDDASSDRSHTETLIRGKQHGIMTELK